MNTQRGTSIDRSTLDKLKSLQVEGEPNFVLSIIEVYVLTSPQLVSEIKKHLHEKRLDLAAQKAHSLKSSSGTIGAVNLCSLCNDLECLLSGHSFDEAHTLGKKIEEEFSSVIKELSQIKVGLKESDKNAS